MSGAYQHAAGARLDGEEVAGADEVGAGGIGIDERAHSLRAILGADAGGGAVDGVDRLHKGAAEGVAAVARGHAAQVERGEALGRQRDADEAAPVEGHEVDGLGIGLLGGDDQIALVLAMLIVGDNDHLAGTDGVQHLGDGIEG